MSDIKSESMMDNVIGHLEKTYPGSDRESKAKKAGKSLMSVAGISHDENAWSDIYAYFLDPDESHGLGHLFVDGLTTIIQKKTGRHFSLDGRRIIREQPTIKGNRIDILIQNENCAVIIENKVFHTLCNDLDDYWISVKGADEDKIGIVLTLTHINTNNPKFINITHSEWLSEVEKLLTAYRTYEVDLETRILLDSFMSTVRMVSAEDTVALNYYFKNREKINNLYNIADYSRRWLHSVFTDSAFVQGLGDFTLAHTDRLGSKNRYAMYKFPDTDEFVVTAFYEYLWNSIPGHGRLYLYLEPIGKWLDKALTYEKEIRKIADEEHVPSNPVNKHFWHCACVEIKFSDDMIFNEECIHHCLTEHLINADSNLMRAAGRICKLLSGTHYPTYRWADADKYMKENWPEGEAGNSDFWRSQIEFITFDIHNRIVILETCDNLERNTLEGRYYDVLKRAVKFAFGDDARFSIVCRNIIG